jgi:hypothetical protein
MPNKTVIAVNVSSVNKGRAPNHSVNNDSQSLFAIALALRGMTSPLLVTYDTATKADCQGLWASRLGDIDKSSAYDYIKVNTEN